MQISVTIVAYNAARFLPACLESVKMISDDIVVVVDDRTTDSTVQIAQKYNARVYTRKFDNFADQKNYATGQARHTWILSLDADEQISTSLATCIYNLPELPLYPAYSIPRKNKIFGKFIEHSNWDPNGIVRLFDKNHSHWEGKIHEQIITDGTVGKLYDPITHDNYQTAVQFLDKQSRYSTARADELVTQKVVFSPAQVILQPLFEFFRRYILHAGFLDGWHGLHLAYLMMIYHLSVWIKVWQKQNPTSA